MKVRVYLTFKLTGLKTKNSAETDNTDEMLWIDASFPALPRTGDIFEFQRDPLFHGTVKSVHWFHDEEKTNVFFPVVYLEDDHSFDKNDNFTLKTTLEEKIQALKQIVEKSDTTQSDLVFECNA